MDSELPGDTVEVPNPIIVVEVLSPSSRKFDETVKRRGYISLAGLHHYVIADPEGPPVIHYSRQADGTISRAVVATGALTLSPPGIELGAAEIFAAG